MEAWCEGMGKRPEKPHPPATAEAGAGVAKQAGPSDVSVFHREDVGWWRSWLQQSYQAVKEKVSRATTLLSAGHRGRLLATNPS